MNYKFKGKLDVLAEDLEEVLSNIFDNYSFGKSPCPIDKNGWVYGNLINGKTPYIVGEVVDDFHEGVNLRYWYPVKKESIGQYTGLKIIHGTEITEIYEGDLLDYLDREENSPIHSLKVTWRNSSSSWHLKSTLSIYPIPAFRWIASRLEIVGNIYDNPELIEEVTK